MALTAKDSFNTLRVVFVQAHAIHGFPDFKCRLIRSLRMCIPTPFTNAMAHVMAHVMATREGFLHEGSGNVNFLIMAANYGVPVKP